MLQFFRKVWQRLWGRLRYCGAVHYLAGGKAQSFRARQRLPPQRSWQSP